MWSLRIKSQRRGLSLAVKGSLALPYCGEECERNLIPADIYCQRIWFILVSGEGGGAACGASALLSPRLECVRFTPPTPTFHSVIVSPVRLFSCGSLKFVMASLFIDRGAEWKLEQVYEWIWKDAKSWSVTYARRPFSIKRRRYDKERDQHKPPWGTTASRILRSIFICGQAVLICTGCWVHNRSSNESNACVGVARSEFSLTVLTANWEEQIEYQGRRDPALNSGL